MGRIERTILSKTDDAIAREHLAIIDAYNDLVQKITAEGPRANVNNIMSFYREYLLEHIANEENLLLRHSGTIDRKHQEDHRMIKELYEGAFGINPRVPKVVDVNGVVMEAAYKFEMAVMDHWQRFDGHSMIH